MDGRDALRTACVCFGGLLLLAGCPSPPPAPDPPASTSSPELPTTAAEAPKAAVRTLSIPTEGLPRRTSTEPTDVVCGIPGVGCEPVQPDTEEIDTEEIDTEEIDEPSPTP